MLTTRKFWPPFIVVALFVLGISASHARPAAIEDNAAFFTDTAKAQAARDIEAMGRSMNKDLAVETFLEIPDEFKRDANLADKVALARLCERWAARQAKAKGVNGVYILLVKTPAHLEVVVGNDTQKQAFTLADRDALVGIMLGKLRAKQFDSALVSGVNFVSSTMRSHLASGAQPGSPQPRRGTESSESSSPSILSILLGVGVVWLVIGIVRALLRAGSGASAMSPASGGGGFLSSLMGGMFGAAAGMWMYNQFSGDHGSSAHATDHDGSAGSGDSGYKGQDTDYSGGGDSGGGGDFGGGGDSGGGGDF